MMTDSKKFDPKKLDKLNDHKRLEYLNPDLIWEKAGLKDPSVLIDIGAGTGSFALLFIEKMKKGKYMPVISLMKCSHGWRITFRQNQKAGLFL